MSFVWCFCMWIRFYELTCMKYWTLSLKKKKKGWLILKKWNEVVKICTKKLHEKCTRKKLHESKFEKINCKERKNKL